MISGLGERTMADVDHDVYRKNWHRDWLTSICEIANGDEQKIKWLDPENTNPHWSFVEYCCKYFDDLRISNIGYIGAVSEGLIDQTEADAVQDFHRVFDHYSEPTDFYDSEILLADPEWLAVTEAAKRACLALRQLISDPEEVRILLEF